MTVLSNGSQTGKTSHEKELVLVQVGKNVIPVLCSCMVGNGRVW